MIEQLNERESLNIFGGCNKRVCIEPRKMEYDEASDVDQLPVKITVNVPKILKDTGNHIKDNIRYDGPGPHETKDWIRRGGYI